MPSLLYIAHPTVHLDHLAAPWVHVQGTLSGMRSLGLRAELLGTPKLVERFRHPGLGSAPARGFARVCLFFDILRASFGGHCVYIRHYHDIAPVYPVLRMLGRRYAVEVNATLREEPHGLRGLPTWLLRLSEWLEIRALGAVPAIVTVSGVLRSRLVQRGLRGENITVSHNGYDPELTENREGAAVDVEKGGGIVFIGNFKPWHRVDLLIEAYSKVDRSIASDLVLVGGGDTRAHEELAQSLGVRSAVRFLGRKDRAEVARIAAAAAVLVLPNTEDYGSPVKVFEYLGSGSPTVLPDLPNIREIVTSGEHALLFTPSDSEHLAASIEILLRDQELASRIAKSGRRLASASFSWRSNAERIIQFLRSEACLLPEVSDD
ncbi:MAG: glycosyltransferase [Candidatus Eisenbacteria bacterium]|nr:glycosyltransferase [Candidatus Eisenbacteria bacterium]